MPNGIIKVNFVWDNVFPAYANTKFQSDVTTNGMWLDG